MTDTERLYEAAIHSCTHELGWAVSREEVIAIMGTLAGEELDMFQSQINEHYSAPSWRFVFCLVPSRECQDVALRAHVDSYRWVIVTYKDFAYVTFTVPYETWRRYYSGLRAVKGDPPLRGEWEHRHRMDEVIACILYDMKGEIE